MLEVMGRKEFSHCRHFLCGGSAGVAGQLRDKMLGRFPWASIVGTYTPPFRPMTTDEEDELATQVRLLQPDIIWVGLSTPKQDRFMFRYLPLLETKLMVGVGAAFLFHTGAIQDSPGWVKRAGLQWLHRLLQEPSRLWPRYLVNVPLFLFHAALQIIGLRSYGVKRGANCSHLSTIDSAQRHGRQL
jgi:N-acetylglucosaminyldiphosphoundecaprenol N-acetyl-beta-D-mannosaminyltransferase